jgi:SNF2 family DNA or RNA helicase
MAFSVESYLWPAYGDRKPFNHQKITSLFLLKNKRAFVLNEMGTGKTLSALWSCDMLIEADKIRRTLIVSPLSTMRSVWGKEILMNMPHRKFAIAHGTRQQRVQALRNPSDFVIINHDGVKIVEEEIIAEQFDVIIIDELTAFKSNSERTKCMNRISDAQYDKSHIKIKSHNKLRKRDGAVWGMTGEITPNAPVEAFYQCKIVNPEAEFLPKFMGQFRDACMMALPGTDPIMWVPKEIAPQIVGMVTKPAIRFTRDECLDLPDTTYQELEIELTPEQGDFYLKMRREAMIELENGLVTAANAAVKLNKLLQISAGAVKTTDGGVIEIGCKPRIDATMDLLEGTPNRKLVIFATFRASIEMLRKELEKRGVKVACIHGDVRQDLRAAHIERFQTGDLNVLILQPQSSAHGITLTASSTILWFSLIPSNELHQQGNARIVRAGQTRKTFIYYFVSTKAERHVANILKRKGDVSSETLALFTSGDL